MEGNSKVETTCFTHTSALFIQILLARDLLDVQAEGREYRESRFNLRVMLLHKGLLRPCTGITS